jgi:peptidoglycan hydrolase-like protein with peptidoglycan-binding domain
MTISKARFTRLLSLGKTGVDVEALQTFLEAKGFLMMPRGVAKGYFGPATKRALMKYQESVGLEPVGIVGPGTRARLNIEE